MSNHECILKPLSPIHISAGSDYQYGPYEYIRSKAKNNDKIIRLIKRINIPNYYKSLDENKQDELINLIEEKDYSLTKHPDALNISKNFTEYYSINKSTKETKDIQEHIKSNNKIYIPGSSIKGSLRTAILYNNISSNDFDNFIFKTKYNNKLCLDYNEYNNIIDNYFSVHKGNKAQKNIMRFIQVSDTNRIKTPVIYDVISIQATTDNTYNTYKRNNNTVRSFIETIDKSSLKFNMKIDNNQDILKYIKLSDKSDILSVDNIKETIYNFSQDLIRYELDFIDKYNIDILRDFYEDLNKINSPDKPLMRIGAGSGLMATTIDMKIKENNPKVFENIRQASQGKNYYYEYPKSRKITCHENKPLGWAQLIIK